MDAIRLKSRVIFTHQLNFFLLNWTIQYSVALAATPPTGGPYRHAPRTRPAPLRLSSAMLAASADRRPMSPPPRLWRPYLWFLPSGATLSRARLLPCSLLRGLLARYNCLVFWFGQLFARLGDNIKFYVDRMDRLLKN